jgi:hypothetical protein
MVIEYSDNTLRLGRESFRERYKRLPSDAELTEYINSFLKLGLALIK